MRNKSALKVSVMGLLSLLSLCGIGCEAPQALAPRADVQATPLQKFPRNDIEFYSNQFFLWPEGVTPEQASRVLFLSDEIDRLESKIAPLKAKLDQLDQDLVSEDEVIRKKNIELNGKVARIKKRTSDLNVKKQNLAAAQAAEDLEKSKANPDPAELQRMAGEIATLQKQITPIESELNTLNLQKDSLDGEILKLNQSPKIQERSQLQPQKRADEEEKQKNLSEVMDIVTWYDPQPSSVGFRFQNGTIRAWISQWSLDRSETKKWDFSTDSVGGKEPTIENLTYTPLGGVFEFDVKVYEDDAQTQLRETYSFRIARTDYEATDGKIHYTGTMDRKRIRPDGTLEIRRGVAKLIDKNN